MRVAEDAGQLESSHRNRYGKWPRRDVEVRVSRVLVDPSPRSPTHSVKTGTIGIPDGLAVRSGKSSITCVVVDRCGPRESCGKGLAQLPSDAPEPLGCFCILPLRHQVDSEVGHGVDVPGIGSVSEPLRGLVLMTLHLQENAQSVQLGWRTAGGRVPAGGR